MMRKDVERRSQISEMLEMLEMLEVAKVKVMFGAEVGDKSECTCCWRGKRRLF
jgi:hypothetical protein